jgi:acyl-CoA thioesterase
MPDLGQPQSPFAVSAGIKVIEASAEGAVAILELTERHCNSQGTTHGGVIFTLADQAFGAAENAMARSFVAIEMHIRFLRPAMPGHRLTATSHRLHQGRNTAFYEIEVRDEANRLIAFVTATGHAAGVAPAS